MELGDADVQVGKVPRGATKVTGYPTRSCSRPKPKGSNLHTTLRGHPRPLDDWARERDGCFAGVPGLEPRLTEPESVVLPITPYPTGCPFLGPRADQSIIK